MGGMVKQLSPVNKTDAPVSATKSHFAFAQSSIINSCKIFWCKAILSE